jgi:ribonuclease P protein component
MTDYETLRKNREFQRAYSRGKFYVSPVLVSYVVRNRKKILRIGITTSKKTGNAVRRNRSRRVIREAFRPLAAKIMPGYDLVFVARAKTPFVKSGEISRIMKYQLKNAGVLSGSTQKDKVQDRPHEKSS